MFNTSRKYRKYLDVSWFLSITRLIVVFAQVVQEHFPLDLFSRICPGSILWALHIFSISLISSFQRRIISPFSGKLCDVSNFQLRLHQREFKMVVPPSKVSNFFQRKEISQKLEAFFHSVSSYHRPIIKFPLKKMILNECAARVDYENRKSTDLQQVS